MNQAGYCRCIKPSHGRSNQQKHIQKLSYHVQTVTRNEFCNKKEITRSFFKKMINLEMRSQKLSLCNSVANKICKIHVGVNKL